MIDAYTTPTALCISDYNPALLIQQLNVYFFGRSGAASTAAGAIGASGAAGATAAAEGAKDTVVDGTFTIGPFTVAMVGCAAIFGRYGADVHGGTTREGVARVLIAGYSRRLNRWGPSSGDRAIKKGWFGFRG